MDTNSLLFYGYSITDSGEITGDLLVFGLKKVFHGYKKQYLKYLTY